MKKSCILLGGGASVKEGINKELWGKIKDKDIWSLNYAFMTMPYLPSREVFVDIDFFKNNIDALQKLSEQNIQIYSRQHNKIAAIDKIKKYNSTRMPDQYYGKDAIERNCIFYGKLGLVGTFALSLAIAEKYNEIFLLGFDWGTSNLTDTFTHYYQNELKVISTGVGRPIIYRMPNNTIRRDVEDYKVFLRETDVKIWNVSLISNINFFEKISYEQFFSKLIE